jgi:2,4-dienoyl-CoA reductase-like NADH-dependent reductase (Old Yellow Enzyme family)
MTPEAKPTMDLFTPIKVGPLMLSNRIVMAPLTRNRADRGDVPREMNVTYYVPPASAGLLITEASPASPLGHGYPATPGIYTEAQVAGWQGVSRAADLTAFGGIYLANPDLPERFARDAPLDVPDAATFYGGDEHGYTDYPILDIH